MNQNVDVFKEDIQKTDRLYRKVFIIVSHQAKKITVIFHQFLFQNFKNSNQILAQICRKWNSHGCLLVN